MLTNMENYGYYQELVKKGKQKIYTKDLNNENIDIHFKNIVNILLDGINEESVIDYKITVFFPDDKLDLYIIQYMWNLMMWTLIVCAGNEIESKHLFFEFVITKRVLKDYIDKWFVRKNMRTMAFKLLNNNIDRCIGKFRDYKKFQMYCCNTLDLKDDVDFMNKYPEYDAALHFDISSIPMEDIKEEGLKVTNSIINYITKKDEDHNCKYAFISGEGINRKQYKEVMVNIGTKPNGQGGVFAHPIVNSFINGGLRTIEDFVIDSDIGRIAQILQKQNVGQSGAFARRLGLNNQDSRLHHDPSYVCDTENFEIVEIKDKNILDIYDMRWYAENPNGVFYQLDATKDKHLIGQTLYFRSPMTCASAARGDGICYKCYGDLAYVTRNNNIGQIAAELLSSVYTQTLLSAKHLLESAIIKLEWTQDFYDLFTVEFDQIGLKDNFEYKKFKLIIRNEDIIENEYEESEDEESAAMDEGLYVYSFIIRYPDGHEAVIRTNDSDPIYLSEELQEMMNTIGTNDEDSYEINLIEMKEKSIFTINVQNDELSKVMNQVKNLINNKGSIKSHDRNSLLGAFIEANLSGGIKINAVHFEVLLMNQIRAYDNILNLPDWSRKNEKYQILTLDTALTENLSIGIRLQSPKLKRTLTHYSNRFLYKASNMDLFTMENPQEVMSKEFEAPKETFESKRKVIKPIIIDEEYLREKALKEEEENKN